MNFQDKNRNIDLKSSTRLAWLWFKQSLVLFKIARLGVRQKPNKLPCMVVDVWHDNKHALKQSCAMLLGFVKLKSLTDTLWVNPDHLIHFKTFEDTRRHCEMLCSTLNHSLISPNPFKHLQRPSKYFFPPRTRSDTQKSTLKHPQKYHKKNFPQESPPLPLPLTYCSFILYQNWISFRCTFQFYIFFFIFFFHIFQYFVTLLSVKANNEALYCKMQIKYWWWLMGCSLCLVEVKKKHFHPFSACILHYLETKLKSSLLCFFDLKKFFFKRIDFLFFIFISTLIVLLAFFGREVSLFVFILAILLTSLLLLLICIFDAF